MMEFFRFKNVKIYYMGEEGLNKDTDPDNLVLNLKEFFQMQPEFSHIRVLNSRPCWL